MTSTFYLKLDIMAEALVERLEEAFDSAHDIIDALQPMVDSHDSMRAYADYYLVAQSTIDFINSVFERMQDTALCRMVQ